MFMSSGASGSGWLSDVQYGLDIVGSSEIPIASQVGDVLSAFISFYEGDYGGGLLSLGGTVIPGLSQAKLGARVAKGTSRGFKSLGAAGKGFNKVLQSGGQSLKPNTLKVLNLTKDQGRNAIHGLKKELGLPNNFLGKIMNNGDYLHPSTGEWLGNLFDYAY